MNQSDCLLQKKINIQLIINDKNLAQICNMVNIEMASMITMVVIIFEDKSEVIGCNNTEYIGSYAKSDSFCQHMLMTGIPLLVNNPQADIKFANVPFVKQVGFKFYLSVPLMSRDDYPIGSLCTIGSDTKIVSISQYSLMRKMSDTIMTIMYNVMRHNTKVKENIESLDSTLDDLTLSQEVG